MTGEDGGRGSSGPGDAARRVLIVEDEADLAWLEQFNLEAEGYDVRWAPEGRSAIVALRDFRPHVVVLDLMLPHVDGWAVLAEARRLPDGSRPQVILVSAVAGMYERVKAERIEAGSFLAKPFEMEELIRMVGEAARVA